MHACGGQRESAVRAADILFSVLSALYSSHSRPRKDNARPCGAGFDLIMACFFRGGLVTDPAQERIEHTHRQSCVFQGTVHSVVNKTVSLQRHKPKTKGSTATYALARSLFTAMSTVARWIPASFASQWLFFSGV